MPELMTKQVYFINGVREIPEGGLLSVRIYSLFFVLKGFNFLLRLYLNNRDDSKYATILTVAGNITLPVFGFILLKTAPAPFIFLAYLVTETLVFAMSHTRCRSWMKRLLIQR